MSDDWKITDGAKADEAKRGKMAGNIDLVGATVDQYQNDIRSMAVDVMLLRGENTRLFSDNRRVAIENETMDIALRRIIRWCDSYPVDVFGEPDMEKARRLLEDGGMTLDSVSARAVRQITSAIREYAQAAIFAIEDINKSDEAE